MIKFNLLSTSISILFITLLQFQVELLFYIVFKLLKLILIMFLED
jgi:hypothetical protein